MKYIFIIFYLKKQYVITINQQQRLVHLLNIDREILLAYITKNIIINKIHIPGHSSETFIKTITSYCLGLRKTNDIYNYFIEKSKNHNRKEYVLKDNIYFNINCDHPVTNIYKDVCDNDISMPFSDKINYKDKNIICLTDITNTVMSKYILSYNPKRFTSILEYTNNYYNSVYLNSNINLSFCLISATTFLDFYQLVLCNIYNYNIDIVRLFDILNKLREFDFEIIFERDIALTSKFILDLVMYRRDLTMDFLTTYKKTLKKILYKDNDLSYNGTLGEVLIVLQFRFNNEKLEEIGLFVPSENLLLKINNYRLENISKTIIVIAKSKHSRSISMYWYLISKNIYIQYFLLYYH